MSKLFVFLNNLTVARRIMAAFAVLTALILVVATSSFFAMRAVSGQASHALRVNAKTSEGAARAIADLGDLRRYEKDYFINMGDAKAEADYNAKWTAARDSFLRNVDDIQQSVDTDREREQVRDARVQFSQYESGFRAIQERIKRHDLKTAQEANDAGAAFKDAVHKLETTIEGMGEDQFHEMSVLPTVIQDESFRTNLGNVLLGFFSMMLAGGISFLLTRSITKPLDATVKKAQDILHGRIEITATEEIAQMQQAFEGVRIALEETRELKEKIERDNKELQDNIIDLLKTVADASDGDLTVRANISTGSLGNVADAFNSLMESLQTLLGQVRAQIESTNKAVDQIQHSAATMTSGATNQAREVQAAKELIEQMSREIVKVSENANSAAEASKRTEEKAHEGALAVDEVVSGMGSLRANVQAGAKKMKNLGDRSMEITGIVGTISRISEQTNMLALNAAIEAARAGEHGRGFSVVADEVRKLAERTASATNEIDKLVKAIHVETNETVGAIEQQTSIVEQESRAVSKAGESLTKIRQVSTESATIVVDISSVAKKQAEGAGRVVRAMEQISAITKSTQDGVEGTRATVSQLANLSNQLRSSMGKFKVA